MSICADLAPCKNIDETLAARAKAIKEFRTGIEFLVSSKNSMSGAGFGRFVFANTFTDRHLAYQIEDKRTSVELERKFVRELDRNLWQHLIQVTGIYELMDATAQKEWDDGMEGDDIPVCTLDNIESTMGQLHSQRQMIFNRGLVKAFASLSGLYRTNDAFKLGKKIIVSNVCSNRYGYGIKYINDAERVLFVLDGKRPPAFQNSVETALNAITSWNLKTDVFETDYMSGKVYKKGTAHITFKRMDLIKKANQIIAAYYGETLPDETV